MPLSEPRGGGNYPNIAGLFSGNLYTNGRGNSLAAASSLQWNTISRFEDGEAFLQATTNRIERITDLAVGKSTPLTDITGGTFLAGTIFSAFRAINGDIWAIVASAGLRQIARSQDDGVTWAEVARPAGVLDILQGITQTSNGRIWLQSNGAGNNLHFSDNNGAAWTTIAADGLAAGGTGRGGLKTSWDKNTLLGFQNAGAPQQLFFITDISGTPPTINNVNLTALLGGNGTTQGLASEQSTLTGNWMIGGSFGSVSILAPDFASGTLITDVINPLYRGTGPGGTQTMFTIYDFVNEGWLVLSSDAAAFFPESSPLTPINITLQPKTAATWNGCAIDANGNSIFINASSPNACLRTLISASTLP